MTDYKLTMPLADLLQDWIESNPRVRSEETRKLMRYSVQHFVAFIGHPPTLGDLTEKNLCEYIAHRRALGRSPRTIERECSKLASLWRWGASRGWVKAPMVTFSKQPPPTPTAYSREELERLFVAAADYDHWMTSARYYRPSQHLLASFVFVALLRMLLDTGERIGAALSLRWSDIDLDGRFICFRAETRKGGAHDNVQRLGRKTVRALVQLRQAEETSNSLPDDDKVFPTRDRLTYYWHYKNILRLAGLPVDRRSSFHKLRRTHATHLYVVGGDATESLGHASDQMTREYYLDPKYVRRDYAADLLNGGIATIVRRLARRVKVAFGYW